MLNVISAEKARAVCATLPQKKLTTENISLCDCLGRTSAADISSAELVPPFDRSTVDGYAVCSRDTYGSSDSIPAMLNICGSITMGECTDLKINHGECVKIATGGMLPKNADSVVMLEYTSVTPDGFCLVYSPVAPFANITKAGDDTRPGDLIVAKNTRLGACQIGALAAAGKSEIQVVKKPLAGIISTGDELVPVNSSQTPGKIRDVNTSLLSALCSYLGCSVKAYGIIPDKKDFLKNIVKKAAAECDIVLISGGSSAGEKDETVNIISELGAVLAHGIACKPGKPTVIGSVNSVPVLGLPGHPAAAYFVANSLLRSLLPSVGITPPAVIKSDFPLSRNISSNNGREEYICVKIQDCEAVPYPAKSGIISVLSSADGYITIPASAEGAQKGETVTVNFFNL